MKDPQWQPDFGLTDFIPSWGATAVGARKFLIAYNINLLATKEQAHRIALNIRENGRGEDQVMNQLQFVLFFVLTFLLCDQKSFISSRSLLHSTSFFRIKLHIQW